MNSSCSICSETKAHLSCAICAAVLCKQCAQQANEEAVDLLEPKAAYYSHGIFCQPCYQQTIAPELDIYNEVYLRAEQVNVFYKSENKQSHFVSRVEKPIRVQDCVDRETTMMKLAFMAASRGFNILVDVELSSEKIHNGGWQTSKWQGRAIPSHVDEARLNRRLVSTP